MTRGLDTINISKASTLTNLFYLFFHGGKAAVIPFLTLFFRLVGLNALDAGIIIAAKTLTSLIWAPLWSRCATAYNRHRLVLMFSLFMMMVTYLSFPALYTQLSSPQHCLPSPVNITGSSDTESLKSTTDSPISSTELSDSAVTIGFNSTFSSVSHLTTQSTLSTSTTLSTSSIAESQSSAGNVSLNQTELGTMKERNLAGFLGSEDQNQLDEKIHTILNKLNLTDSDLNKISISELITLLQPLFINSTTDQLNDLSSYLKEDRQSLKPRSRRSKESVNHHLNKRSEWPSLDDLKDKLHTIQTTLQRDKFLLFLVVLAIVVVGEIFASPVEKVADDSWFDFLNRIDDLERYGQQRFWGSIAFVLVPIIVTVAVDHTPCFLPYQLHHYLLHFYIFAILMAAALVISCCYPVPPPVNSKHTSKFCKGLHTVCCDGRGFLFSVTLFLTGTVYAAYHNFLFWRMQDLGSSETAMGLCVSIGAFSEIPMLIMSGRFVKKLGPSWMVSVALLVLSLRVLYYAFIPNPWAILPIELTHGVTHTTLWFAILSYDDFNIGASLDRTFRSILSSFYFGIGFSAGSFIAGLVYHSYGSSVLFIGGSAVTGLWFILFSLIQMCIPHKEKVRYIKLLRSESDNSEDEEEDWLEMALKDH